jgi:Asp-tRNA(Asn)/Glu-tRNA(Gln) amidotransferase A subunit family amidase
MQETHLAHSITILSEMVQSQSMYHYRLHDYSYESQISLSIAQSLSNRDYIAAQKVRRYSMDTIQNIFQKVDIILSPTTAMTAPEIPLSAVTSGESNLAQTAALMRYIIHGNFLGIPALSIPVGYDTKGLPISVQFQSNHYHENLLFRIAHACETTVQRKKPQLFYSIESSL